LWSIASDPSYHTEEEQLFFASYMYILHKNKNRNKIKKKQEQDPITGHMPPSNNASDWSANGAPRKNSIPVRCVHLSIFAICIDVLFLLRLMQSYRDLPKSLSRQELIA
jgi:hypothetical protein